MKCKCCDCTLTDYEATIRNENGTFEGLCLDCLDAITDTVDIPLEDRIDLREAGFDIDFDGNFEGDWGYE